MEEDLNAYTAGLGRIYQSQLEQQEAQTAKLREAWKLAEVEGLLAQKRAAAAKVEAVAKPVKTLKDDLFQVFGTGQQMGTSQWPSTV